jgi:ribosomal-protein-alanine N-acetyltransferase
MRSRIVLRPPTAADAREFADAALASKALHHPWITAPTTPEAFRAWRKRMAQPTHCALLACRRDSGEMVGVFNITNMVMGPFCSAFLGYYAFAGHERQGLMAEGLQALLRHAFGPLKLHRLEANIQPGNTPSIALVRRCGFALEGYSPRYLKIGGRWRDHERWAIVASWRVS